ncbi:MAG: hypothetical protein Q8M33_16965 [Hydrogenophaga sp.]|nr:hypothetical protein [Hydrogenophaga sp.]
MTATKEDKKEVLLHGAGFALSAAVKAVLRQHQSVHRSWPYTPRDL